jgi:outer membrane protein TolC
MKRITLLVFMLVGAHATWGQSSTQGEGAIQTFFNSPETVLPKLYAAAVAHSGEIERLDATKDIAAQDVKLAKKRLLSTLAIGSSYNYGTLPYFASADATPVYQFNPFSFGARAQYSAGINASIPFDLVLTRNITIRRQELVMSQAIAQRKTQEMTIHQLVIQQYQALRLARTMLLNYQDALQSANINKKIADKRFKEGEIQVDEQMAALDLYSKALLAQEDARNRYQTAQLLLEDLIGTSINNIMLDK